MIEEVALLRNGFHQVLAGDDFGKITWRNRKHSHSQLGWKVSTNSSSVSKNSLVISVLGRPLVPSKTGANFCRSVTLVIVGMDVEDVGVPTLGGN